MSVSGWADVADDLLFLLAERVFSVVTFIRLSAVCKSWYSITSATRCCNPVPWLMLAEREGSDLRDFYDHSTGELYQLSFPDGKGMMILGSSQEWLITATASEGGCFHLLNPITGAKIALSFTTTFPRMFTRNYLGTSENIRDIFILRAACSTIDLNGNYIVAASHMGHQSYGLSYWKSTHKEWCSIELSGARSVNFVGDVLFVLTLGGVLYRITFKRETPKVTKITTLPIADDGRCTELHCYTLECNGSILVVHKIFKRNRSARAHSDEPIFIKRFRVLKLEGNELRDVISIGDYALFLGKSYSFSLKITPIMKRLKKNCIYFVDDRNEHSYTRRMKCGSEMGVFDLAGWSLRAHYPGKVANSFPSMPIWVTGNLLQAAQGFK